MKIFIAGATGALGRRLVPVLVATGHQVIGMTRTPEKAGALWTAGAEAVLADGLNRNDVMNAVMSVRPDVVVHQMTALASLRNLRNFEAEFELTNRLRTQGTEFLLAAAQAAGAKRFVAQSYTGWTNIRTGSCVKSESDALDPDPPKAMKKTLDAIRRLEQIVLEARAITGVVLRYGSFYGPGTSFDPKGEMIDMVRRRKFPIFGGGGGIWSFIHVDDAASATRLAIEMGPAGVYNVVDDTPTEVSVWLPTLAAILGAKPPFHLPAWLGRLVIGEAGALMMTQIRGASNAKAKSLLGWQPSFRSWRDGFKASV